MKTLEPPSGFQLEVLHFDADENPYAIPDEKSYRHTKKTIGSLVRGVEQYRAHGGNNIDPAMNQRVISCPLVTNISMNSKGRVRWTRPFFVYSGLNGDISCKRHPAKTGVRLSRQNSTSNSTMRASPCHSTRAWPQSWRAI